MIEVLKIVGIVLASLILLMILFFLSLMFVPFRYKLSGSNKKYLTAGFTISYFLSIFRIYIYYKDKMGYVRFRFFGIKIFDNTFPEVVEFIEKVSDWINSLSKDKKNKDGEITSEESEKTEKAEGGNVDSEEPDLPTVEEAIEYIEGEDEFDNLSKVKKNKEFLGFLKDLVLNAKKKWYNFKEFVDTKLKQWKKFKKEVRFYWKVLQCPSLQPTLILLKDSGIKVIKHVFPKKIKGSLVFGDEDAYFATSILKYCFMLEGMFPKSFSVTPVWNENKFVFDLAIKGRLRLAVMMSVGWKLFTNKHLRRMIRLFRKGGNISGGK